MASAYAWPPQTKAAATSPVEGDWQGTLQAGGAELRVAVHIKKSGNGYEGTLDSIDQGSNDIPVSEIVLKDSKLTFTVAAVQGSYEGTVSSDGAMIKGMWTQGQSIPLDLTHAAAPVKKEHKAVSPSDIDGDWTGAIDAGGTTLRIIFHITTTDEGLAATMDSPDQSVKGLPVTSVARKGASLKLQMKQLGGGFEGQIGKDLKAIDGTWSQGGNSLPLTLKRT